MATSSTSRWQKGSIIYQQFHNIPPPFFGCNVERCPWFERKDQCKRFILWICRDIVLYNNFYPNYLNFLFSIKYIVSHSFIEKSFNLISHAKRCQYQTKLKQLVTILWNLTRIIKLKHPNKIKKMHKVWHQRLQS